ncbi:MAG: hypothetical protein ACRDVE_18010 [Actinocrinis sp.]
MSRAEQALLDLAKAIETQLETAAVAFRELRHPKVLESGTFRFNAAGVIARDYQVPYSAVVIVSQSGGKITAANQPNAGVAPSEGQGTAIIGPYGAGTYNLTGRSLTLYGTAGDFVTLTTFVTPQPPTAASGQVAIAGTATVSGTITALTPATSDLYTEATVTRLVNGNTATLTWPPNVTEVFIGINVTAYTGGTGLQIVLQQQDANGIWQAVASSATLTATGAANMGAGPGQAAGAVLRDGGPYRLAWIVTGTFTALAFQLAITAR